VPANAKLHGSELGYILEHSEAKVCFASSGIDSEIAARAASGHATAEPPTNEMKSRRLMCPQFEGPNLPYRRGAENALCNTAKSGGRGPVRVIRVILSAKSA
jgi:hypothetical protein